LKCNENKEFVLNRLSERQKRSRGNKMAIGGRWVAIAEFGGKVPEYGARDGGCTLSHSVFRCSA
jgi:hypothetical protein